MLLSEACPTQIRVQIEKPVEYKGKNLTEASNVYFLSDTLYEEKEQWQTRDESWSIWFCDPQNGGGWCVGTLNYHWYIYSQRKDASCPTNVLDWLYGSNQDYINIKVEKSNEIGRTTKNYANYYP